MFVVNQARLTTKPDLQHTLFCSSFHMSNLYGRLFRVHVCRESSLGGQNMTILTSFYFILNIYDRLSVSMLVVNQAWVGKI